MHSRRQRQYPGSTSVPEQRFVPDGGILMSAGLRRAQARPSSGLARGRAGVHEMVDILAIAGVTVARGFTEASPVSLKSSRNNPRCCALLRRAIVSLGSCTSTWGHDISSSGGAGAGK